MSTQVSLVHAPFAPAELLQAFERGLQGEGGVVSFTGYARATGKDGAALDALVLESYRGVTLKSMEAIAASAASRFAITHSMVVHRAGRIAPGEAIVFVAAASAHRRAAFEAADFMMDRLKTEAVLWKREESAEGARWIEPTAGDHEDAQRWHEAGD